MEALASALTPVDRLFFDGLGERRLVADPARGEPYEVLYISPTLASVPSFEFALRERVSRLAAFRHISYGSVRGVERLPDPSATLALSSEHTKGVRLSDLLSGAEARHLPIDINAALCLVRQLVPAAAMLHEHARDAAHGAIGPERLIVTPNARVVIVEHVLGAALEQLRFSHERYWNDLRIPLPPSAGAPRFDQRADVIQIGLVALALILGRVLRDDEYPTRISELVASTWAVSAKGGFEPLPPGLRAWLGRALQLDPRHAFSSAIEARVELEKVLGDSGYIASPASLENLLAQFHGRSVPAAQAVTAPKLATAALRVEPAAPKIEASAPPVEQPRPSETASTPPVLSPATASSAVDVPKEPADVAPEGADEIEPPHPRTRRWLGMVAAAAALIVLSGGVLMARRYLAPAKPAPANGKLLVTTSPAGAQAFIDGRPYGVTPLTVPLPAGTHILELRAEGDPRIIPVTITSGTDMAQFIEMPKPAPPAPVRVVELPAAKPAAPEVSVPAAPAPGWLSVSSPVDVQLYERDRLIGTSAVEQIMLPAGRHEIELVNDNLGYRAARVVQVVGGKTASVKIDLPKGTIALNAVPWADVWIDGDSAGQTPIGNLSIPIGSHDIVFRHPQLGERHYSALVTLKAPSRLSVDLRTP